MQFSTFSQGQILDLSNAKNERQIVPTPYDSSFINFSETLSLEEKAGIVGQRIYIAEITSTFEIKDLADNYLESVSRKQLSNQYWKVIKFENDYPSLKLTIENESGKRLYFIGSPLNGGWYLDGGLEKARKTFIGEVFSHQESAPIKFESVSGEVFSITKPLKVTDIQFAKLDYGYSLVAIFENGLIKEVTLDLNDKKKIEINYETFFNVDYSENRVEADPAKPTFSNILDNVSDIIAIEEESEGDGEYDDSGDGVFGRRVTYRDFSMIKNGAGKSGKIVFKVCVNRRGKVTYAEIVNALTTIKDKRMLKKALQSIQKYTYEPDFNAPRQQCGRYTLKVDNYNGIR